MHSATGNHASNVPSANPQNRKLCLVCGKPAVYAVTVLERALCLECMRTISQIDVSDDNYCAIMEKLKDFWEPVLAEAMYKKDQDEREGYDHREDHGG